MEARVAAREAVVKVTAAAARVMGNMETVEEYTVGVVKDLVGAARVRGTQEVEPGTVVGGTAAVVGAGVEVVAGVVDLEAVVDPGSGGAESAVAVAVAARGAMAEAKDVSSSRSLSRHIQTNL